MSEYQLKHLGDLTSVDDVTIEQTERTLNIRFPSDVKKFLKTYNGARFRDYSLEYLEPDIGVADTAFTKVLDFSNNELTGIVGVMMAQQFPPNIIPFARDAAQNYFCLDFRAKGLKEPPVIFCSLYTGRDDPFIPLADNFAAFMSLLHDDDA